MDDLETHRLVVRHEGFSELLGGAFVVAMLVAAASWMLFPTLATNGCATGSCDASLPREIAYHLYPAQIHARAERRIIEGVFAAFLDTDRFHAVPDALHGSVLEEHTETLPLSRLDALQEAIPTWRAAALDLGHRAATEQEIRSRPPPRAINALPPLSTVPNGFVRWLRVYAEQEASREVERDGVVHRARRAAARASLPASMEHRIQQVGAGTILGAFALLLAFLVRRAWTSRPLEVLLTRHELRVAGVVWPVEDGVALAALADLSERGYDDAELRALNRELQLRTKARDGVADAAARQALSAQLDTARRR